MNNLITNNTAELDKMYAAYHGNSGFKNGAYLVPFPAEDPDKFTFRKSIAMYDNSFKMILDGNLSPIFNDIIRENSDKSDFLNYFMKDCDGKGTPFANKIRQIGVNAEVGGFSLLLFDNIKTTNYLDTAKAIKEYPKLIEIKSNQVISYKLTDLGNIENVTFYKNSTDDRYMYYNDNKKLYPNGYFKNYSYDEKGEVIEGSAEYKAAIAEPIIYTYGSGIGEYLPESAHNSLLSQTCTVYGIDSLIAFQAYMNTFKTIVVTGGADLSKENAKFGEDKIWQLSEGSDMKILESPSAITELAEAKAKIKKNMFENYNLGILNTSSDASGESREQADTLRMTELLRKSQIAELNEKIIMITFAMLIKETIDYKCEYPTAFKPSSMIDAISVASSALQLGFSPANETRIRQKTLSQLFSSVSREEMELIQQSELDYNPVDYDDNGLDDMQDDNTGDNE